MLILTFEEFKNIFDIDNKAMSNIKIEDIGKYISLTPIEIIMRDEKPEMIDEPDFNIIINLHLTDGKHWVSVEKQKMIQHITLIVLVLKLLHYSWKSVLIQALMGEYN